MTVPAPIPEVLAAKAAGAKTYTTGKPCIAGHVAPRYTSSSVCTACSARRSREHFQANKDALQAKSRAAKQTEAGKASAKAYAERTKEQARERARRRYQEDRRRMIDAGVAYKKEKYATDALFALKVRVRNRITSLVRARNLIKSADTQSILGCDWPTLAAHIEGQFLPGMSWENRSLWHIDHRVPLALAKTPEEVMMACHYKNLRPLWAADNLRKGARVELEPEREGHRHGN